MAKVEKIPINIQLLCYEKLFEMVAALKLHIRVRHQEYLVADHSSQEW